MNNQFLIEESPVIASPTLAQAIGINEAILLQVVHFLSNQPERFDSQVEVKEHEGRKFIYAPASELLDEKTGRLRWLSNSALHRCFARCRESGLLISHKTHGTHVKTWYAIDYDALEKLLDG